MEREIAAQSELMWYGITAGGRKVHITHEVLMRWAYGNEQQFNVGWSHAVEMPDGTRLARSKQAALLKGWKDVAEAPFG